MKGLDIFWKQHNTNENKWSSSDFDLNEISLEMSDNDKEIINFLSDIAYGELTAITTLRDFQDSVKEYGDESKFIEIYAYMNIIAYDEIRHGLVLLELKSIINGDGSFIENVDLNDLSEYALTRDTNSLWESPYDLMISYTIGEHLTSSLYKQCLEKVDSLKLKNLFENLINDELKHLNAWTNITNKVYLNSDNETRKHIIDCVDNSNGKYQTYGLVSEKEYHNKIKENENGFKDLYKDIFGYDVFSTIARGCEKLKKGFKKYD